MNRLQVDPLDEVDEVELEEEALGAEREELEPKERLKLFLNLTDIPVSSLPRYAPAFFTDVESLSELDSRR